MKCFFAKLGRFLGSWLFWKIILWGVGLLTLLIFLIYAEEDWRGARELAATKAKWEAKGESFDFSRLIPPPRPR